MTTPDAGGRYYPEAYYEPADREPPYRRGFTFVGGLALVLYAVFAAAGAVGFVVAVSGFLGLSANLTPVSEIEHIDLPEQSVILDRTGKVQLASFGQFRRDVVAFRDIPPVIVDATTAVEDHTFWDNPGFDPLAIVSAGIDTIRGRSRGASTITQQLVRQRLLDPELVRDPSRTVERKLKEIIQSIRLTQAYPDRAGKERVMAAYLNLNYYGNDSYGIKAAAQSYFGVTDLSKLTLAQAAILAAIPQAPSTYDLVRNAQGECQEYKADGETCAPGRNRQVVPGDSAIVQRRNSVLGLMSDDRTPLTRHEFTAQDFAQAQAEKVILAPQRPTVWLAPHFVWQVRDELTRRLCGQDTQSCKAIEDGGLRVTTTLDWRLQQIAQRWVKAATIVPKADKPEAAAKALGLRYEDWMKNLSSKRLGNGALVALDYQTGELVAYVGSADYYGTPTKRMQPQFDVLSKGWRQPGSAFKPVMYSIGIDDKRLSASTMLMDVVTDFGGYVPTDADNLERGPVRLRDALRFSLNIPAVKSAAVIGPERIFGRAQAFGLNFERQELDAGLSIALGVEEVHPVDLVGAYGTIANLGRHVDQTTILKVEDTNGKVLLPPRDQAKTNQVISPQAAYVMTDILSGNTIPSINPFWGRFELAPGGRHRPATLKTGTNNDAKDLNAYGYIAPPTDEGRKDGEYALAVGVWNGNSDNSLVSTAQAPLFSIDVSTFVWQGFMRQATDKWAINEFPRPDGLIQQKVDPWTGLAPLPGGKSVDELFIPDGPLPQSTASPDTSCGAALLDQTVERGHDAWLKADRDWIARSKRGPGIAGGPKGTRNTYFYNGAFTPYGRTWGPLLKGEGCETPSPRATLDACGSPTTVPVETSSVSPSSASPSTCPSPSASESASPTAPPTVNPTATPPATPPPTPPPTPTPGPTLTATAPGAAGTTPSP